MSWSYANAKPPLEEETSKQFYKTAKLQEMEDKAKKSAEKKYEMEKASSSNSPMVSFASSYLC